MKNARIHVPNLTASRVSRLLLFVPNLIGGQNVPKIYQSHKIYAPKGVGALYVRKGTAIDNFVHGAGQEGGKESGY